MLIPIDTKTGKWTNPETKGRRKRLRLVAVGDICPCRGRRYDELFADGDETIRKVYGDTLKVLHDKDLSVVNFELPLSDRGEPIIKNGPNLIGRPGAIAGFVAGGFDVADMANNHVLDYGPDALGDTIATVRASGIVPVGAGENDIEAALPVFVERAGIKVGIIAVEENEFCNATRSTPGASSYRPGPNCVLIGRTRDECDLLIVFVHGSSELCPFPSPRTVRDFRSFIDAGADAVIGHHAHTVQGMELYRGKPIIFNLGNFLFWADPASQSPQWWKRMFVRLTFAGRDCAAVEVFPFDTDFDTAFLRLLKGQKRSDFLAFVNRLSEIVADADLHERFGRSYCTTQMPFYMGLLEQELADLKAPDPRKRAADMRNLFQCEAHSEVISTGLDMIRQGLKHGDFGGVEDELRRLMS
jgi:hypothetical protein